jgi:hypothetical protein
MRVYLNRKVALHWKVIASRYRSCKRRSMNWRNICYRREWRYPFLGHPLGRQTFPRCDKPSLIPGGVSPRPEYCCCPGRKAALPAAIWSDQGRVPRLIRTDQNTARPFRLQMPALPINRRMAAFYPSLSRCRAAFFPLPGRLVLDSLHSDRALCTPPVAAGPGFLDAFAVRRLEGPTRRPGCLGRLCAGSIDKLYFSFRGYLGSSAATCVARFRSPHRSSLFRRGVFGKCDHQPTSLGIGGDVLLVSFNYYPKKSESCLCRIHPNQPVGGVDWRCLESGDKPGKWNFISVRLNAVWAARDRGWLHVRRHFRVFSCIPGCVRLVCRLRLRSSRAICRHCYLCLPNLARRPPAYCRAPNRRLIKTFSGAISADFERYEKRQTQLLYRRSAHKKRNMESV